MHHRPDIEGLRAVAVLAVLAYHLDLPGLTGGYIGVDVFFVISGFLITSLLLAELERTGTISLREFYARRIRRLLPIATVVLMATAVGALVVWDPLRREDLAREIAAAAVFIANLEFAAQGTDYLRGADLASPVQHFWSLSVEEQFYLLWPGLILLAATLGRQLGAARTAVGMVSLGILAASLTASIALSGTQGSWSYFGLHTRAWELALGAVLAVAAPRLPAVAARAREPLAWLGLAGIAWAALSYSHTTVFPGSAALLPVVATAVILLAGSGSSADTPTDTARRIPRRNMLEWGWMQWVGARSYGLYLWHWPVIILLRSHLDRGGDDMSDSTLTLPEILIAAGLTLLLTELGYRLVENPARHSVRLQARPGVTAAFGAALVLSSLAVVGLGLQMPRDLGTGVLAEPLLTTTLPPPTPSEAVPSTAPATETPSTAAPDAVEVTPIEVTTIEMTTIDMTTTAPLPEVVTALGVSVAPDNLRPSLRQAAGDVGPAYRTGCQLYLAVSARTDCVFGDPEGEMTMALWGDSHAAQWLTPLDAIARARGWRLLAITQSGCPVIDVITYNRQAGQSFTHCAPWRTSARELMRAEGVDMVVLTQYYALLRSDGQGAIPAEAWREHLPGLLDSLRAEGIEPVVMGDTPDPSAGVPGCVAANRFAIDRCEPGRGVRAERLRQVTAAVREAVEPRAIGLIRPDRWLCVEDRCPVVVGDVLVYRDAHHLSETMAAWLQSPLEEALGPFMDALQHNSQLDIRPFPRRDAPSQRPNGGQR